MRSCSGSLRTCAAERACDRAGVLAVDGDEHDKARVTLDERRDVTVGGAGEQIALPVAGDRAVCRLGRPLPDRDGVNDLALAAVAAARGTRTADRARAAKVREQLPLQRPARLHEQRQVDRLVRHPHSLVVGIVKLQPAGNLLRRPVLPKLLRDDAREARMAGELASLRARRPLPRATVSLGSAVAAPATMAVELARDRRRRPAETGRDSARGLASSDAA